MRFLVLFASVFVSGCITPFHYDSSTENMQPEELAQIYIRTNEIYILEINGEKYKHKQNELNAHVYLEPGVYSFTAMLTWENILPIGTVRVSYDTHSKYLRRGCLKLEAGTFYHFFARNPGDNWIFVVSNDESGSSNYRELPAC